MSDKNNKKQLFLIATAIGAIMGIYAKVINEIKKDLIPDKPAKDLEETTILRKKTDQTIELIRADKEID